MEQEARRKGGLELGMEARRHWYVRSHDGQFYDAPAVEGGVGRLRLDPIKHTEMGFRDDHQDTVASGSGTHSTLTDLWRSKRASLDDPGRGFLTFLIT